MSIEIDIEDIISSLKKDDNSGVYSNLAVEYPVSSGSRRVDEHGEPLNVFFDQDMAEASRFLVFEEIYKSNNEVLFSEIESLVYNRYHRIIDNYNPDFIFSLKMPFLDWVKLQIELGYIIVNVREGVSILSISKPMEELLKIKLNNLYSVTREKQLEEQAIRG